MTDPVSPLGGPHGEAAPGAGHTGAPTGGPAAAPATPAAAPATAPATAPAAALAGALAGVLAESPADALAPAMSLRGLAKRFGEKIAVNGIDLDIPAGSLYGIVGPNGAGKTTTLSMATGLLRPEFGTASIHGIDIWEHPVEAKKLVGILADGVRLFDRLTGEQLVTYNGLLSGLDAETVARRTADLLALLDLTEAGGTLVVDYSAGMTKKIALACALVHAPRVLVLDEPFESVDPISAANIRDILAGYVAGGGTVIVSSHSMDLVQRMCDRVAIVAAGRVLAAGTLDEVRAGASLEDRFVELVGGRHHQEGPEWLRHS